jgi:hypothetical protein
MTNYNQQSQNETLTIRYEQGLEGTLLCMQESAETRYEYEIWFDYTLQAMNKIKEGTLVAVENFARAKSLLEIISILPMHYALGERPEGYPGYVVEAARSASRDWIDQENEATEDVTKIRCIAIPTNLELRANDNEIKEETNLPMIGAKVYVLDTPSTEVVLNYNIRHSTPRFVVGQLIRDPQVRVEIVPEEMLRTHFAIFGFTGAGKSNLLSTLINKILNAYTQPEGTQQSPVVKILVFDLMSEYATLLPDWLLHSKTNACVVALTERTLPQSVLEYMKKPQDSTLRNKAILALTNTSLYPKALSIHRKRYQYFWQKALSPESPRLKVWKDEVSDLGRLLRHLWQPPKSLGANEREINQKINEICNHFEGTPLNKETFERAIEYIEQNLENARTSEDKRLLSTNDARECVREWKKALQEKARTTLLDHDLQAPFLLHPQILLKDLDNSEQSSLYVFQSSDPDRLRKVAAWIGQQMFERRRWSGRIEPLVLFLMDEADEFIPQKLEESYKHSRDIAMNIARRGRKFGLCLGIATQRVRYLDTSIMAQPHTYFVSKMPRKSDREAVAEAFGISEEMFRQTFKFQKGDWLLMSYDAVGLEAVPIPIHCENANERIEQFLIQLEQQIRQRSGSHVRTP